jgi:phosphoglycolate phosphatase
MKRLFLFDLDGTLVSTGGAGMRALSRAFFDLYGIPDAMGRINPSGKTDPAIFREMIKTFLDRDAEAGELERIGECYLSHLETEMRVPRGKGVLPGVMALVEHLSGRADAVLALGTGNLERGARFKLAPHALNEFFPTGGFGSDAEDRSEVLRFGHRRAEESAGASIPPANVFVIGDTPLDVAAARRAGYCSVAVATGRSSVDVLRGSGPDVVMPDLTHAFPWLETLLSREPAA